MDEETTVQDEIQPESPEAEAPEAPDFAAKEAELAKKERDLQKGFDEIARRERELQSKAAPPPVEEEDLGLTPEADKVLSAKIARETRALREMNERIWQDMAQSAVAEKAKEAGLSLEDVERVIVDRGLQPSGTSRRDVEAMAETAIKLHKAETFDESAMEERIRAKLLEEMANEGADIVSVKQGRANTTANLDGDVYAMSPDERMAYYEAKGI